MELLKGGTPDSDQTTDRQLTPLLLSHVNLMKIKWK